MPYYTKKGTSKKDKGKTCVYKKDDNTKVGCTAGSIEKYLGALHASEKMNESNELNWLKGPIQLKYKDLMDDLDRFLKVGDTIYLTGELYIDAGATRAIILNRTKSIVEGIEGRRLKVYLGEEVRNNPLWISELGSDCYNIHLGDMVQDNEIMVDLPEKNINESESGLEWISDIGGDIEKFIQELSKLIKQHVPVAELELDWDTTSDDGEYFGRIWLYDRFYELYMYNKTFIVRFYALDPETDEYYFYQEYRNLPKTRLLTVLLNDMISVSNKNLNESEEDPYKWIKDIETDELSASPDIFFRSDDEMYYTLDQLGFDVEDMDIDTMCELAINTGYRWSDKHNGWYHRDEVEDFNRLRESEGDELDWVKDVELDLIPGEIYDIKTGNGYYWVPEIYVGKKWDNEHQIEMYKFKDLDGGGSGGKSTPYVKDLMGKGNIRPYDPNWSIKDELTFSEDIEDALKGGFVIYFKDGVYLDQTLPIQDKLFEMGFSFYSKGPNEYITNKDSSKKIQFFECFNWDTSNPRYERMPSDQWDIKKVLLMSVEEDKGRWRSKSDPRLEEQELFLTVRDHDATVINGDKYITNNVNESEEFDWIQKQEPEKELSKSKRYVIDVSNLRPAPMIHSHDTSLTKQDILRKLEDLGYDVEHIDVDAAKYFYVEPTEGGPSWQYDEYDTPIPYDYWVDYNTDLMDDPSYGGKYQMINVDEFMFLIDNNLIGESEDDYFGWVRDIMSEPISVCEAADVLSVGNNIMINNLPEFAGDNERRDVNAEILAIDYLQQIQPDNKSNLKTILVHINDDYLGFGRLWVESFKDEYIDKCLDGRCMFLICGDKDFNDTTITPMSSDLLESKKTINEVAGISFESRKWADIIYDEIISNPEEKTRLIIDGYDHQEAFNGFPIDYIVIDYYDKITGYGQEHSGYDKDGNYVVLLYVQPQLVRGQGGYSLKSALNHEMKHAWEDYNRLSKGLPSIEQTKESKQLYNKDFILLMSDNNITGPIKDILKYYYYLSSLETSPYLENVYDGNPAYENMVRQIATKDFESFKNRFDLDINWHLINTAYNIPFVKKFKSPRDFIDYSAEELRSRANKVIKKINKMKYIHNKI